MALQVPPAHHDIPVLPVPVEPQLHRLLRPRNRFHMTECVNEKVRAPSAVELRHNHPLWHCHASGGVGGRQAPTVVEEAPLLSPPVLHPYYAVYSRLHWLRWAYHRHR